MRFMLMVKASLETEEDRVASEKRWAGMATFREELAQAGVLVEASALQPSSSGWRIRCAGKACEVIAGPFAEPEELVAGYVIIQVASREEALDWSKRFANLAGEGWAGEIEFRPFLEPEDFVDSLAVKLFSEMGKAVVCPDYF